MSPTNAALAALAIALTPALAIAQGNERTKLPPDHPLIGSWRLDLPRVGCFELYHISANGTMQVTSGEQSSESEVTISPTANAKGFYLWQDKIVKDNGKPDCMGHVMQVGNESTNFIMLDPNGRRFRMCQAEDEDRCIGPFIKQEGI